MTLIRLALLAAVLFAPLVTPEAPDSPPGAVRCWAAYGHAAIAWEQRGDADHVYLIRHSAAGDTVVGYYVSAPGANQIDLSAIAVEGDRYSLQEEARGGIYGQYGPYQLVTGLRLPAILVPAR